MAIAFLRWYSVSLTAARLCGLETQREIQLLAQAGDKQRTPDRDPRRICDRRGILKIRAPGSENVRLSIFNPNAKK
jgi:hypothetical protein